MQKLHGIRNYLLYECDHESIENLKINKAVSQKAAKFGLKCKMIPYWSIFQDDKKKVINISQYHTKTLKRDLSAQFIPSWHQL
jgi:hypothetical protein